MAENPNPVWPKIVITPDVGITEHFGVDSKVGSLDKNDGTYQYLASGRHGDLILSEALGEYYELAKSGRLFGTSRQAGAVFGTALTATAITYTLYNPPGSMFDLVLLQTCVTMSAGQVTTTNAPIVVYGASLVTEEVNPITNTELVIRNARLGGPGSWAKAWSASTLPSAPIVIRVHPAAHVCQNLGTVIQAPGNAGIDYVNGAIVLGPNTGVTLQGIATTTQVTMIASMLWAELPR